mgnify:CR=1 FL=1
MRAYHSRTGVYFVFFTFSLCIRIVILREKRLYKHFRVCACVYRFFYEFSFFVVIKSKQTNKDSIRFLSLLLSFICQRLSAKREQHSNKNNVLKQLGEFKGNESIVHRMNGILFRCLYESACSSSDKTRPLLNSDRSILIRYEIHRECGWLCLSTVMYVCRQVNRHFSDHLLDMTADCLLQKWVKKIRQSTRRNNTDNLIEENKNEIKLNWERTSRWQHPMRFSPVFLPWLSTARASSTWKCQPSSRTALMCRSIYVKNRKDFANLNIFHSPIGSMSNFVTKVNIAKSNFCYSI